MKRFGLSTFLVLISVCVFSSCTSGISGNNQTNTQGNTVGNIVNGGLVSQQGDWLYFAINSNILKQNNKDSYGLYKMSINGKQSELILQTSMHIVGINAIGDWIYFYDAGSTTDTYRIRTNGTDLTKLNDDNMLYLTVIHDWIYYHDFSEECIYKVNADGKNRIKINDDKSYFLNVVDNWIYYSNKDDQWSIYKIRTDGTERTKLGEDETSFINVVNGWIYYINQSDGYCIYKIRTDGTERTKLNSTKSYSLNVVDDWIYFNEFMIPELYQNVNETGNLFKIRINGTDQTQLTEDEDAWFINVVDDWIFYMQGLDLYRIRTDGTDRQLVE